MTRPSFLPPSSFKNSRQDRNRELLKTSRQADRPGPADRREAAVGNKGSGDQLHEFIGGPEHAGQLVSLARNLWLDGDKEMAFVTAIQAVYCAALRDENVEGIDIYARCRAAIDAAGGVR